MPSASPSAPTPRAAPEPETASVRDRALSPELLAAWEKEMAFTPAQYATMAEFRKRAAEEGLAIPWSDNLLNDFRFCQARDFKLDLALKMWRDHVAWRRQKGLYDLVDSVDGRTPRLCAEYKFDNLIGVKEAYQFGHHKVDSYGRPVVIDRVGAMDYKKLKGACPDLATLMEYFIWYAECTMQYRMPAATLQAGRITYKGSYIIDLKGFGLKSFTKERKDFLLDFTKIMSDNYPECVERMFIINSPFVFRTVWALIAPILTKRTRDKIKILGGESEYRKYLDEMYANGLSDLPTCVGGTDESCDFMNEMGPWASILPKCHER